MSKKELRVIFKLYLVFIAVLLVAVYGCAFITVEIDDGTQQNEQQETSETQTLENETDTTEILN